MILVAVLLVGGAFLLAEYRNKKAEIVYTNTPVSMENDFEQLSDNVDWKKILIVNDISTSTNAKDLTLEKEKLTSTDLLGRDFFARYMELRQIGGANDKTSQEDLVTEVLRNGVMMTTPKTYTVVDILTKEDSSSESLRKYGNDVGSIIKKYSVVSRNEAVIAKDAMDKENMKILEELDPIVKSYKNTLAALLKVQAPTSISKSHLELVNAMSSMVFIAEGLRKSGVDPLAGIQAVARYAATAQQFASAINNIKNQLTIIGIVYAKNEGGVLFIPNKTI
jgi:hypothetical protein